MDARTTVEDVEVSTLHWIGGERIESAGAFADISPIDETLVARVARGGAKETELAVAAARRAFAEWGATPPPRRARVLHAVADGVQAKVEQLAAVETRDNGSLLRSMRRSVMPRVARNFRWTGGRVCTWLGLERRPGRGEASSGLAFDQAVPRS